MMFRRISRVPEYSVEREFWPSFGRGAFVYGFARPENSGSMLWLQAR